MSCANGFFLSDEESLTARQVAGHGYGESVSMEVPLMNGAHDRGHDKLPVLVA